MIYLISIDSDGTIRHSDGIITNKTKKVINDIIQNQHIVVICTARPRYHTLKISKEIGTERYLISSNGTEVFDNINNKTIYVSYLPKDVIKKIYYDIVEKKIRAIFVSDNMEYATQFIRNDSQVLLNDQNVNELFNKDIKQIMIIGKAKNKIQKYQKIVEKEYGLNIIDSSEDNDGEMWFSIISKDASKGIALEKLAKYLNIPIENTIAIGNDKNDVSMFNVAGLSVAVANASDDIKSKVDYVTLSNDEDGVAKFLETLL